MSTVTTQGGTEIHYKDWGSGQPVVFSHGWPLSADDWADLAINSGFCRLLDETRRRLTEALRVRFQAASILARSKSNPALP